TQPRPQDSNPPKTTPTTAPGPDHYPTNSLGSPQPSPPITACQRHQPPPSAASLAITAHHCLSLPQPPPLAASLSHHRYDCHITAGLGYHTALSCHISPGTTHHPPPPAEPPNMHPNPETPIMHHNHASLPPNLHTPRPAPAPSSPPHHRMSLRFQCKTSTPRNMSQPHPTLNGPQVSPPAPAP
ncbi:hypothetical protein C0993_011473, partial [Termitomyces sp. T159_Od127]